MGSVFVDPVGFALFGPRVGVEVASAQFTVAAYGRWFNMGLLSRSLFLADNDQFTFSAGAGARGRYYVSQAMSGLSLGIVVEYLRTRIENQPSLTATVSQYLVPQMEVGYRWRFGDYYAGLAAALGYARQLTGKVSNLPGGTSAASYEANNESSIYGSAAMELGWMF
jgi:hypothetical protein